MMGKNHGNARIRPITLNEILVGLSLIAVGAVVSLSNSLRYSLWWYPDSGYMELWVVWCAALIGASVWLEGRSPNLNLALKVLWILTIVVATSGFFNLNWFILHRLTTGDLFMNHFLGAQRAAYGMPVYDVEGLHRLGISYEA